MTTVQAPAVTSDPIKRIRLNRGVVMTFDDPGEFRLSLGAATAGAQRVSEWLLALLRRLESTDVPEEELQAAALAHGGPGGLFRWVENVRRLDAAGMLARTLTLGEQVICRLLPLGAGPSESPPAFDPAARQRLSRFAVVRRERGALIAQHPGSHLAVELGRPAIAVVGCLTSWTSWADVARGSESVPGPVVRAVLEQLIRAAVLDQLPADAQPPAEPPGAVAWNLFDWWLHSRTRNPRIVTGWGGSYPGRDRFDRQPAAPAPLPGRVVDLPVPDLSTQVGRTAGLVEVMESRRSVRAHDDAHPISIEQLAELFYRTARTRSIEQTLDGCDEIVDRPYPSGGGLHELEIYPVVRRCAGLDPGMWHYRSVEHRLEWVAPLGEKVDPLLWSAQSASTMAMAPQVLLVISARFGRVMWKYESIAYALTLKNVGVLFGSLYLVATEMGLAPLALGSGDSTAFGDATGLDRMVESSVGEFVIGSRPASVDPGKLLEWGEDVDGVPVQGIAARA